MQAMGAPLALVCSNTSSAVIADDERASAQLHELAERAARRDLRIGYEALAWGREVKHFSHAWSIVKRASHPQLGLIVDSFHTLALGDDPGGIKEIPGDKIFFMQLADAPLLAMDVLLWRRRYSCFPGQGQFDLVNFVEQVLKAGYAGNISLEVFNELFREASNRRTAIDAMRSLLFLEGEVRKRLERATSSSAAVDSRARPVERIELFDPPAAPSLAGICSLEFAVDDESGRAVGTLLENLGFRPAGRHRSKEVTLYRQGNIDLILNAEPNSHARTHFLERGASVCGIGLRTDDPFRALKRATALHCERVDIGSNELSAIRAPDGSLIYFVPSALGLNGLYEMTLRSPMATRVAVLALDSNSSTI
jgi:4-hydroxyphenylpyruvate dioxygenase